MNDSVQSQDDHDNKGDMTVRELRTALRTNEGRERVWRRYGRLCPESTKSSTDIRVDDAPEQRAEAIFNSW